MAIYYHQRTINKLFTANNYDQTLPPLSLWDGEEEWLTATVSLRTGYAAT